MDEFCAVSPEPDPRFFRNIYDSKIFGKLGTELVDLLTGYLKTAVEDSTSAPIAPVFNPQKLLKQWELNPGIANGTDQFMPIVRQFIEQSIVMQSPRYMGHMNAVPTPIATLCDFLVSFLNSDNGVFEQSSVGTVMEKRVIDWMCEAVGYGKDAGGFITSGGSLGNLTCLLAARQVASGLDVWKDGIPKDGQLAIMASDQSHYCARRAAQIMGLGESGVVLIKSDETFHINSEAIEDAYRAAKADGKQVFAIVGSACNTAPGTYENLNAIADFAEKNHMWFHVDAAHGGTAVTSRKYKHLLNGIERADSVVWDFHKTMMMSSLATAVLFKDHRNSYQAVKQDAPYLYKANDVESDDWYTLSKRTMECTKTTMSLKPYMMLEIYGAEIFERYVDVTLDAAREFAAIIKANADFELILEPESNIVCFKYNPTKLVRGAVLDDLQKEIRQKVLESGRFCIVQTVFKNAGTCLRVVFMNPLTASGEMVELIALIEDIGGAILGM